MIENMIGYDWNVDVEEKEKGTRTEIVSAWEIKRNMVVIGSERGNTGIIADGEVTQGTKVGVGIARIEGGEYWKRHAHSSTSPRRQGWS